MNDANRPSPIYLIFRMFGYFFGGFLLARWFWNSLSGRDMFPLTVALWCSVVMTALTVIPGWLVITFTSSVIYRHDHRHQMEKRSGFRPYWDTLPWPVQPRFVPPKTWMFCCPVCCSRVEKQIDVCWNCGYGADGDSTAYFRQFEVASKSSGSLSPEDQRHST